MNSLWQFICSISIALAVTACAPEYDDPVAAPSAPTNQTPEKPVEKPVQKIDGMEVDKFYAQMFIKVSGSCRPNTVSYQYPQSHIAYIGINSKNNPVYANISVVMTEDKKFRAIYREWIQWRFANDYIVVDQKVIEGEWKIDEVNLLLDGVGVATGLRFNNHPAMRIKFDKNIISQGIENRTMMLEISKNLWAPFPEFNPCDL